MMPAEQKKKLLFLHDLLNATGIFYFWEYDSEMNLLHTTCQDLVFDHLFTILDGKKCALEHALGYNTPLVFWHSCGLIWLIDYYKDSTLQRIQVIGPLNSAENKMSNMTDIFKTIVLPVDIKLHLKKVCDTLPTMSLLSVFPYIQMLHKALTGENLPRNQIHLQQNDAPVSERKSIPGMSDYHLHYTRLQDVLQHIREGTLNYQNDWDRLSAISTGVSVSTPLALERARISIISFITFCQQAAIDGGMTPDMAFSRSANYLEALQHCRTLGDMQSLNHTMYEDFIRSVRQARQLRTLNNISRPIQICCDYISINIEQEISIQELATHVGYSDYYLSRKFHKEMHVSISEYINIIRIERAKFLLRNTNYSIQEISNRLHYCSHSYFTDVFRKLTQMTPKQYRIHQSQTDLA